MAQPLTADPAQRDQLTHITGHVPEPIDPGWSDRRDEAIAAVGGAMLIGAGIGWLITLGWVGVIALTALTVAAVAGRRVMQP